MTTLQKISPNLWFDTNAQEAAAFYVSVFPNSHISRTSHYGQAGFETHGMAEGTVMTVEFELDGQQFIGLNGGPHFKFNEAISFVINCDSQAEVDGYWEKLGAGGDRNARQCGWLKDRFGVSWQVVPRVLGDMMLDHDRERADRVMAAMLRMKKLDIQGLQQAYDGEKAQPEWS